MVVYSTQEHVLSIKAKTDNEAIQNWITKIRKM